ncbi:hypothetical protein B0H13DRAFT_1886550 [Mycena leptocephala]|nr:hypothetical protein B0H13DRAFT_1886550 [Mycena leptocephala]
MTCGIHYDLKLVDGKPLAAIQFTVFGRLMRKASGPKPKKIYTAVQIVNGEMVLGHPVSVDRDPVSRCLQVMYDQQLLSLTEALFCADTDYDLEGNELRIRVDEDKELPENSLVVAHVTLLIEDELSTESDTYELAAGSYGGITIMF